MTREILATITCPHCGNAEATVHQQAKGKGKLYYRCYQTRGGVEQRCGTVQIHGPAGQEWIRQHMHGERPEAANDPKAPEPAPTPAPEAANDPKGSEAPLSQEQSPRRSSVMGRFLAAFNEED